MVRIVTDSACTGYGIDLEEDEARPLGEDCHHN
jgi:hypothetical protein